VVGTVMEKEVNSESEKDILCRLGLVSPGIAGTKSSLIAFIPYLLHASGAHCTTSPDLSSSDKVSLAIDNEIDQCLLPPTRITEWYQ